MNKNFTLEDLIRYAYNETTLTESVSMQQAIDEDYSLCNEYVSLIDTMRILDKALTEPSENTVNRILAYAQAFTVPTHA